MILLEKFLRALDEYAHTGTGRSVQQDESGEVRGSLLLRLDGPMGERRMPRREVMASVSGGM